MFVENFICFRYALEKLQTEGLLHLEDPQLQISKENSFPSKFITDIEKDKRSYNLIEDCSTTQTSEAISEWLGEQSKNENIKDDIKIVQYVCAAISERCALLASLCVAELCNRNVKVEQTVAVDGSVFKHHPLMKERMAHFMSKFAPSKKVVFASLQHYIIENCSDNFVPGRGWVWQGSCFSGSYCYSWGVALHLGNMNIKRVVIDMLNG